MKIGNVKSSQKCRLAAFFAFVIFLSFTDYSFAALVRIRSATVGANGQSIITRIGVSSSANSALTNGLVAYWSFNGKDLTDKIYDRSCGATCTSGDNAYFVNAATSSVLSEGKVGQGIRLKSASSQYVLSTNVISAGTGSMSMCAWYNATSSKSGLFNNGTNYGLPILNAINSYGGSGGFSLSLLLGLGSNSTNAKPLFIVDGATTAFGAYIDIDAVDGNWHHICGVHDSTNDTYKVYFDGNSESSASYVFLGYAANKDIASIVPYKIGGNTAWSPPVYSDASFDEVRIYNRVLTNAEVMQLYKLGRAKVKYIQDMSGPLVP